MAVPLMFPTFCIVSFRLGYSSRMCNSEAPVLSASAAYRSSSWYMCLVRITGRCRPLYLSAIKDVSEFSAFAGIYVARRTIAKHFVSCL